MNPSIPSGSPRSLNWREQTRAIHNSSTPQTHSLASPPRRMGMMISMDCRLRSGVTRSIAHMARMGGRVNKATGAGVFLAYPGKRSPSGGRRGGWSTMRLSLLSCGIRAGMPKQRENRRRCVALSRRCRHLCWGQGSKVPSHVWLKMFFIFDSQFSTNIYPSEDVGCCYEVWKKRKKKKSHNTTLANIINKLINRVPQVGTPFAIDPKWSATLPSFKPPTCWGRKYLGIRLSERAFFQLKVFRIASIRYQKEKKIVLYDQSSNDPLYYIFIFF